MFRFDKRFRRRVHIEHRHGELHVTIERNHERSTYAVLLIGFTAAFVFFLSIFIPPIFREPSSVPYTLPFLAFILLWYTLALRLGVWRLFGVEEIVVRGGEFHWTRTALRWVRTVHIPVHALTQIRPVTPWHSLSNKVEITTRRSRYGIGDMLLGDETQELAHRLAQAVGLRSQER